MISNTQYHSNILALNRILSSNGGQGFCDHLCAQVVALEGFNLLQLKLASENLIIPETPIRRRSHRTRCYAAGVWLKTWNTTAGVIPAEIFLYSPAG